jgi:hypothetical protein
VPVDVKGYEEKRGLLIWVSIGKVREKVYHGFHIKTFEGIMDVWLCK